MDHARFCRGCARDEHRTDWRCARAVRKRPLAPLNQPPSPPLTAHPRTPSCPQIVEDDSAYDLAAQLQGLDSKATRSTASELTTDGAKLYDLLQGELQQRDLRNSVVSRPQDVNDLEKALRNMCQDLEQEVANTTEQLTQLASDEANLEAKIENKRAHLERQTKRLSSLTCVRPAFLEEYERLENELQQQYVVYLEQFRNLDYLENEVRGRGAADGAGLGCPPPPLFFLVVEHPYAAVAGQPPPADS